MSAIARTDWDTMADEVHELIVRLRQKPEKRGYQLSPGGILNAYREGDITFEEAVANIEARSREAELAQVRSDRDRLAAIIGKDPCRAALVKLISAWESGSMLADLRLIGEAQKALADTEGTNGRCPEPASR
jgi:hypothetical protein